MAGYTGKYLVVNLTDRSSETVEPSEEFYKLTLGGYGLGAAVITSRQKPGIDPLSPESHLGFCTGLLTGTGAYFSGRFMVVGKSPLTGGWGDANCGGKFSLELKRTGYDAVFFTGKSPEPVWVSLTDSGIEFKDAALLWGKDTLETEEEIKKSIGDKKVQVSCIGVSGERLSLISGIVTDGGRIAARSGLGAVMGSKNLKAFAVRGNKPVPVHDPEKMKELNRIFLDDFKKVSPVDKFSVKILNRASRLIGITGLSIPSPKSTVREIMRRFGTCGTTVYSALTGDSPVKNWDGAGLTDFPIEMAEKISDNNVISYQKKKYACQGCPLACGGIIDIKKGRYAGTEGHKPEYETLAAFGSLILNDDPDAIIDINELCNRAGIDTISTGGAVAFAIECFEKNIISEKDTDGLRLAWGDAESVTALTEMIIDRRGIGDILADGVKIAAKRLGRGSEEFAVHAGGQELPMHDSRLDHGLALIYQCEATPGRHTIASYLYGDLYGVKKKFPSVKKMAGSFAGSDRKKISILATSTWFMNALNGCGMCHFGALTGDIPLAGYINAATGWDMTDDDYLKTGERILNIRKAFNVREGIFAADSRLADRAYGKNPLKQGPLKGVTVDIDRLQSILFEINGWDTATGGPTQNKIDELRLTDMI